MKRTTAREGLHLREESQTSQNVLQVGFSFVWRPQKEGLHPLHADVNKEREGLAEILCLAAPQLRPVPVSLQAPQCQVDDLRVDRLLQGLEQDHQPPDTPGLTGGDVSLIRNPLSSHGARRDIILWGKWNHYNKLHWSLPSWRAQHKQHKLLNLRVRNFNIIWCELIKTASCAVSYY